MKSWKRKLRMGMVGGGQGAFIGEVHRWAAQLDHQVELVAGCFSRDPKNTKKTGRTLYLDDWRCYDTYKQMAKVEAALPEDQRIDFVSVVTPNAGHYDISKTFLQAGFHVVCDKPMTLTLDQAKKLTKQVEKSKRVFAVTHNYTANPLVKHARELFRAGKMGKVRKVVVEYLQDWLMAPLDADGQKQAAWRTDPKQSGIAGCMGDIGSHAENLMEYITGERITELCADLSAFIPKRRLDDDANLLFRLKGGGKGVLTASQIACGEENGLTIRIYGSKGAIRWNQENPNRLEVSYAGKPWQVHTRGQDYLSGPAAAVTRTPSGHPEGYLEAFANIYGGVTDAIRKYFDGKPLKTRDYDFPTVYDGLRGMEFIYKVVESSRRHRWVKM